MLSWCFCAGIVRCHVCLFAFSAFVGLHAILVPKILSLEMSWTLLVEKEA